MNKNEIIEEMKKKIIIREWDLQKVKTKKDEAVLRGKIEELKSMISLIEHLSEQKRVLSV